MCDIYLVCEVIPNVCQGLATHLRRTIPSAIKNCKSRDNPIKQPLVSFSIQVVGILHILEYSRLMTLFSTAEIQFWFLVDLCEGCNSFYISAVHTIGLVNISDKH